MTHAPTSNATTLEIRYSRPRNAVALLLIVALTGSGALNLWAATAWFIGERYPAVPGVLAASLVILVWLAFGRQALRGLYDRQPLVVLDEHGITDRRRTPDFIPWLDVRSITVGFLMPTRRWVVLQLHPRAAERLRERWTTRWGGLVRDMLLLGDWHASLSGLQGRPRDVAEVAERLRVEARRRDAAARAAQG